MGKENKCFNRTGYSSSFTTDCRHPIETMGESEGFGSSGRLEVDMANSEHSHDRKRKCISLNIDKFDSFNVPLQVHSLSKMSRYQRKELELKLRSELEQVLHFQKKVLLKYPDEITVSPSSDILSCSAGQKRPMREISHEHAKLSSMLAKKKTTLGRNINPKHDLLGRVEFSTQTHVANNNDSTMKQCEVMLKKLATHRFGWVFKEPVDPVKLNIPDYFNIIKHPMDFSTIKSKIALGVYSNPLDFAADVRLTFSNAMIYNPPGNDYYIMADTLRKFFETRWMPIEKKVSTSESLIGPAKSGVSRELEVVKQSSHLKKRKEPLLSRSANPKKLKKPERIMTLQEKMDLSKDLESLKGDSLEVVFDFLRKCSSNPASEAEVEVDIDALSDDTLFALRKLLDDSMMSKHSQEKGEACEIELLNKPLPSNSSLQHRTVEDSVDEDVDIGGNDHLVSSYPPVEIEKDAALRASSSSSSSSSTSDSHSSSSDSDSGSSSGSESSGVRSPFAKNSKTESPELQASIGADQDRSDVLDPVIRSRFGLNQTGNSIECRLECTEFDNHREGANAPSKGQISPQKSHRAALLKSRFADTILRAREKTLDKFHVDKGDPEKLRKDREELERLKREEMARLQTEAKAAEDATIAEAKRKLELEREAARLALQKMEKTVDINENCDFLENLEMLGSVPTEHLPSSVDETSPNHSQEGLGSFKFRGSNPLEQLGLYIKVDYEEEDDDDITQAAPQQNDVEVGEIH